jgi:hypothetical protein
MASAYKVAKARLVALLNANATLAGKVLYGDEEAVGEREVVCVLASPGDGPEAWSTIGQQARDEEIYLVVTCTVVRPGDSQQEATERCEDLWAEVEEVIGVWLSNRGHTPDAQTTAAGVYQAQLVRVRRDEWPDEEGRGAQTIGVVEIKARKTN